LDEELALLTTWHSCGLSSVSCCHKISRINAKLYPPVERSEKA
ncbi:unnamed protein product, partial [Amoebophrya sp. A25]